MRPWLLKGHERPLTCVRFNSDSDLLFTCAKDSTVCLWRTDNGERIGTYGGVDKSGHQGAVQCCDISFNTSRLLTAASDKQARLWNCETGETLATWEHSAMVRCAQFSEGERMFFSIQDHTFKSQPTIFIYNLRGSVRGQDVDLMGDDAFDPSVQAALSECDITKPVLKLFEPGMPKIHRAIWGDLNRTVICGDDQGFLRVWDVEAGKQITKKRIHNKAVSSVQAGRNRTMFITSSPDKSAKLFDIRTCEQVKMYKTDRQLNEAHISPTKNHIIIGGGQDAEQVTTTGAGSGHFEVDFHHLVYENRLGSVTGHFGPVNTLSFSPDGKMFATGGEDGYVRLHVFDDDYFDYPDL